MYVYWRINVDKDEHGLLQQLDVRYQISAFHVPPPIPVTGVSMAGGGIWYSREIGLCSLCTRAAPRGRVLPTWWVGGARKHSTSSLCEAGGPESMIYLPQNASTCAFANNHFIQIYIIQARLAGGWGAVGQSAPPTHQRMQIFGVAFYFVFKEQINELEGHQVECSTKKLHLKKPCSRLMLARFPWISNTFITFIWPIDVFEKTRQVTHALEVLVGVVLVNVHLHHERQHELHREALKCTVFSYSCIECSEYLVWHRCTDNNSTNGSPDYSHRFSSTKIRADKIEQEYLLGCPQKTFCLILQFILDMSWQMMYKFTKKNFKFIDQ